MVVQAWAANAAGQTHNYKVSYDPLTGRFDLWRDGSSLGTWTDTTAVKSGSYVSLRTDGANVLFDNLSFTRESRYYDAGGTRVAVRSNASTAVNYLLGDHLGSQALTLDQNGGRYNTNTELRYYPYGVARYTTGTTPTSFNFTGQRKDSGSGLLFYGARWYDPVVGRFLSPDTIVPSPGNPQSLNRYSYVGNRPLNLVDPTGHAQACADGDEGGGCGYGADEAAIFDRFAKYGKYKWFAQAYASIHVANLAETQGAVFAADVRASSDAYLQEARNFLPQHDWRSDAVLMADPSSAYQVGSVLTAGGAKVIGAWIGSIANKPVHAGEAGSYADLTARRLIGDDLEAHHMPQKAIGFTSSEEGGALMLPKSEHAQTRTYSARGALTVAQDTGKSFRAVLSADIWDVRSIAGSKYNQGLQDLIEYYRINFPDLMRK